MDDGLFQLRDVSKRFQDVQALTGVSAALERGSYGLLGPNGAGKSTLIKLSLGLVPQDSGTIRVLGLDPVKDGLALRSRVGYMPEGDCYLEGFDAVELCAYAGELNGLPRTAARQRASSVLNYVGLGDKRYLPVESFSSGQKQRVKLAQALVHDPELLFLDEPTNGLDPEGRTEMLTLISELPARRGCSIILSSHLLPDVEHVCDRVVILAGGRLRFAGTLEAMRGSKSRRIGVRTRDDHHALAEALSQQGCAVEPVDGMLEILLPDGAEGDLIWKTALEVGAQIRHFAPEGQSLERAFLRVLEQDA